jgi:hypothetical protein
VDFVMPPTQTLRLIDGGANPGSAALLAIAPRPLPQLTRRPGDHLELYSFARSEPLAAIRVAAQRRDLDPETGLALVIERSLIGTELYESGGEGLVAELDRESFDAQASVELWSAHGSYLHHLLGLRPGTPAGHPLNSPRVALPVRLVDRLGEESLELTDNPDAELGAAVAWEIAALLAGETMSEWAYRTATVSLLGNRS